MHTSVISQHIRILVSTHVDTAVPQHIYIYTSVSQHIYISSTHIHILNTYTYPQHIYTYTSVFQHIYISSTHAQTREKSAKKVFNIVMMMKYCICMTRELCLPNNCHKI